MARCLNCKGRFEGKRGDAQFCDSYCRSEYHSREKKIDRKVTRIKGLLDDLRQITAQEGDLGRGRDILQGISDYIQELTPDGYYQCTECGQRRFTDEKSVQCGYCTANSWEFVEKFDKWGI